MFWSKEVEEKIGLGGVDPYGLLELENKRWLASPEEVKKAYRRLILTLHPDKKAASTASKEKVVPKDEGEEAEEEGEGEEDSDFKLLSAAWELLGDPDRRRAFDSVDYSNDNLPTTFRPNKTDPEHFFRTFGGPFRRQGKFSQQQPCPVLGDVDTPYEEVSTFYRCWLGLRSWRDFELLAEHDIKEAGDREERRWMQRGNKNQTAKIKKEEGARVLAFVELAYEHDPRIAAHKEAVAQQKAAIKEERERTRNAEREAVERAQQEVLDVERRRAQEAEAVRQAGAGDRAESKREKERARSALKKARKELRAFAETARWRARAADLEAVASSLPLDEVTLLHAALAADDVASAEIALDAALQRVLAQ